MTKSKVIVFVVVGGIVLVGGAALAMAATSAKPVVRPPLGPPPPPPPDGSLASRLLTGAYDELNKDPYINMYTGGEDAKSYIVKNVATGGLYGTAKGIKNVGTKIWHSIF